MEGRRQVLSYSDSLAAPSGDVDFDQPLPSLVPAPFDSSRLGPNDNQEAGSSSHRPKASRRNRQRDDSRRHSSQHSPSSAPAHLDAHWGPPPPREQNDFHVHPSQAPYQPGITNASLPFQNGYPGPNAMMNHGYPPHMGVPLPPLHFGANHQPPHMPFYTGPPPGFESQPPLDPFAPPPPTRSLHPPHFAPPPQQPPIPTGPRSAAAKLKALTPSQAYSTPFLASPAAYNDAMSRSASASYTQPVQYTSEQFFVWPGSQYSERTTIVIDDWDLSSDEGEDDGEEEEAELEEEEEEEGQVTNQTRSSSTCALTPKERRLLAKTTRARHDEHVRHVLEKASSKTPTSALPLSAADASIPLQSPSGESSAAGSRDNNLYEKKQLEIKAMLERIKKLEASRGKAKMACVSVPVAPATAAPSSSSAVKSQSALASEDPVAALASAPQSSAASSVNGQSITLSPSPRPLQDAQPALSKLPLTLDPLLAEQRRKLLESMKRRKSSAESSAEENAEATFVFDPTPSAPVSAKRKADGSDDLTSADGSVETSNEIDGPQPLDSSASSSSLIGRQAKRQRKKERRRAQAQAQAQKEAVSDLEAVKDVDPQPTASDPIAEINGEGDLSHAESKTEDDPKDLTKKEGKRKRKHKKKKEQKKDRKHDKEAGSNVDTGNEEGAS